MCREDIRRPHGSQGEGGKFRLQVEAASEHSIHSHQFYAQMDANPDSFFVKSNVKGCFKGAQEKDRQPQSKFAALRSLKYMPGVVRDSKQSGQPVSS